MKKNTMKLAMLSGLGIAGYMYMKKNPNAMNDMKKAAKKLAKTTYEKLEDID